MAKIPTTRFPRARLLALVLACESAAASRAQDSPASPWPAMAAMAASAPDAPEPDRSFALPALESVTFDLLLSNLNRATSGSHDYDVSWHSIEHNLRGPWVVDNDPFSTNQFAHPYQGPCFAWRTWWATTAACPRRGGRSWPAPFRRPWASTGSCSGRGSAPCSKTLTRPTTAASTWAATASPTTTSPSSNGVRTNAAQVDYAMDCGLPGNPGYSYDRPFDYFNFEAALSSANGVENLTSNGMLVGDHFAWGDSVRGIAGVYGGSEELAPQIFRVSTTSVSLGTTLPWWAAEHLAIQGGVPGGVGYAAASSTLRDVDNTEYHFGMAPRGAVNLRVIEGERLPLDVAGRLVSLGQFGVYYTLPGRQDFGTVDWRHPD
jgi:hypothetical protein